MRQARRVRDAESGVVRERLEVEAQVERESLAAGPRERRPLDDGRIAEVGLFLQRQNASPCVDGCVCEKAGSSMQRSKMPITVA